MTSLGSLLSQSCGLIWASTGERPTYKIMWLLSAFSPLWTVKLRTSISCQMNFPSTVAFFHKSSKEKSLAPGWALWLYIVQMQSDMAPPFHIVLVRSHRPCLHASGGHYTGREYQEARIVGVTVEYLPQSIICPPVICGPSICKMYFTYSQSPRKFHTIKSSPQIPEP